MNRRSLWAKVKRVWITVGVGATIIFTAWSLIAYRANGEARGAMVSDGAVTVSLAAGVISFAPAVVTDSAVGFLFFPGALVDPVAYAPLLRAVAASGTRAWIVELPRRGAFNGGNDQALWAHVDVLRAMPGAPRRWVLGGHSRGGVAVSDAAARRVVDIAGFVIIGSSHPRDVDLSAMTVPVTKIVGTRDGLASPEEVEGNRKLLPPSAAFVWVQGGNHSQFGWYGFQPGDRWPQIAADVQRKQMIDAVLETLRRARER